MPSTQIPLNISLSDDATLDNFFVTGGSPNHRALEALMDQGSPEKFIYLWGATGSGLSHLLQAACHRAESSGLSSQYLPLQELAGFAPAELLEGLEHLDLLCLDDIETVLGRPDWDETLFHLFNRMLQHGPGKGGRLLVAADCAPRDLACSLPDLMSRLASGTVYRLETMTDDEKAQALKRRAGGRGLEMNDETVRFVLHHGSRAVHELFETLDLLDRRSLAEKRKLTIPFIKEILGL